VAAERAPAFQFYPRDFVSDSRVTSMSLKERGAYITLICHCWTDGVISADHEQIAKLLGVPITEFRKVWPAVERCFTLTPTGYTHKRLDEERQKQASHRQRQSDRGKVAATKRWAS
jgi:uncharacterized protein YdaU (DUF1376 family)